MDITLRSINLNLLLCLQQLLQWQSVTKAAKCHFVTQAAMSKALMQLRSIFQDELLVREGNKMVLTSLAEELRPRLQMVLTDLHGLVNTGHRFDPKTSTRVFSLGMTDYCTTLLLPKLVDKLSQIAPNVSLNIVPVGRLSELSHRSFTKATFELGIGKMTTPDQRLLRQDLFADHFVCVFNHHHTLASLAQFDLDAYLRCPHVAIFRNQSLDELSLVEQALIPYGCQRDIRVRLPYMEPIFQLIQQSTELIATVPEQVAKLYQAQYRFCIRPIPFHADPMEYGMLWLPRHDQDVGLCWLRSLLTEVSGKV